MNRDDLELTRKQLEGQVLQSEITIMTMRGALKEIDLALLDVVRFPKKK